MRASDLYAEPPERFVAARDALAVTLRRTDPALAAQVARLRKPTLAVWVVNQLARRSPRDVARFVERGARDHALLDRLLRAAAKIFEEADAEPSAPQLRRVEETLLAGPLSSGEDRAALLEGRLSKPLVLGDIDTVLALAASRRHPLIPSEERVEGRSRRVLARGERNRPSVAEQRAEALEAAKNAEAIARRTAERLAAVAESAGARAAQAQEEARAARRAAEASAREAKEKAAAARAAPRRAARSNVRRRAA